MIPHFTRPYQKKVSSLDEIQNKINYLVTHYVSFDKSIEWIVIGSNYIFTEAYRYAIPEEYYYKYGIRRYGFHGTSHQYVINEAARILQRPIAELNMVFIYLETPKLFSLAR